MSAYVISEVDVRDTAGFEAYRTIVAKSIAQYGGRYLVRGGAANQRRAGRRPKISSSLSFLRWRKSANICVAGICRGAQGAAGRARPPPDFR